MVFAGSVFGWCLGHEGGALTNRISALLRRELAPSLSDHCHVRTQWEDSHLETRKWALTWHWICWHLDLGFPCFWNWRNKCFLFKPPSLWYVCYSNPNWSDIFFLFFFNCCILFHSIGIPQLLIEVVLIFHYSLPRPDEKSWKIPHRVNFSK